ncbi:MAG: glycosyltransferase [Anaerolineae bacterium]|nr:glycosyltransferase [Anaerolineae bacterium]
MIISTVLVALYFIILTSIAMYGFNALIMSGLFLWQRRKQVNPPPSPQPGEWPRVLVQLPIFNERFVVERLIDAAAALDYPADRLSIQVLDDSTDETQTLARARIAYHAARGVNITYVRRPDRVGFKAGAIAYGLAQTDEEFIAIFDADFKPQPDFLRQVMPHFAPNAQVGMVQTRWGHLNAEAGPFTRAQALALDGHFVIEQNARSRSGLFLNFNGSGGVWRRAAIAAAGGWQWDTICEDFDLSYRAQLAGWKLLFLPHVVCPAEIPPTLTAYKRQQFRWAKGSVQSLLKLGPRLLRSRNSVWRKTQAVLHMGGYLLHPLMLAMILIGLPVILTNGLGALPLGALGLAGFAPPILFGLSQWALYPDWKRRFAYFPFLVLLGAGVALNNSWAVFEALTGRNATVFLRTPKFRAEGRQISPARHTTYHLPLNWTTWGELLIALYCLVEAAVALTRAPGLTIFLGVYAIGYLYTAGLALWQSGGKTHFIGRPQPSGSTQ